VAKKTFAVKDSYRKGMGAVVQAALAEAGLEDVEVGQFHLDGTVTVILTEAQLETARAEVPGWMEYTVHGNSGAIRVTFEATEDYFAANSPVLTDEERNARQSKGSGKPGVSKAESEARRRALEDRKARLRQIHGVDLDEEV
jgi:hypothetical protein